MGTRAVAPGPDPSGPISATVIFIRKLALINFSAQVSAHSNYVIQK